MTAGAKWRSWPSAALASLKDMAARRRAANRRLRKCNVHQFQFAIDPPEIGIGAVASRSNNIKTQREPLSTCGAKTSLRRVTEIIPHGSLNALESRAIA